MPDVKFGSKSEFKSDNDESNHPYFRVRQFREDGGVNHYNVIQVKGRAAFRGQPKMSHDGSVKY